MEYTGLANKAVVVVVTVEWYTPMVVWVEFPVFRGVAGEAVSVLVAGEAVVVAVGTCRSFLVFHQQWS
jgi:hypothetical protein